MKQLLTYLLLLSFVVLLTPRSLWHDCDHDHDEHNHDFVEYSSIDNDHDGSHHEPVMEEDCIACDFDLGYFTKHNSQFYSIIERVHCENTDRILARLSDEKGHTVNLRGPPVTI